MRVLFSRKDKTAALCVLFILDAPLFPSSARADYHRRDFTFTAAWIPYFIPSLLSPRIVDVIAGPDAADDIDFDAHLQGDGPEIDNVRTRIELPPQLLSQSAYALRLHWAHPRADLAIGYHQGRDHLPHLSELRLGARAHFCPPQGARRSSPSRGAAAQP